MYIVDSLNQRIRKITVLTGIITTIAGTGTSSFTGDAAAATSATLSAPRDVKVDSSGTDALALPLIMFRDFKLSVMKLNLYFSVFYR